MKVYTPFTHSASITRRVTYAKLTHTVAQGVGIPPHPTYFLHRYLSSTWVISLLRLSARRGGRGSSFVGGQQLEGLLEELGRLRSGRDLRGLDVVTT